MLVFTFVCLAWIFFRAKTMRDAWAVLSGIFTKPWGDPKFPVLMAALLVIIREGYIEDVLGGAEIETGPDRASRIASEAGTSVQASSGS